MEVPNPAGNDLFPLRRLPKKRWDADDDDIGLSIAEFPLSRLPKKRWDLQRSASVCRVCPFPLSRLPKKRWDFLARREKAK